MRVCIVGKYPPIEGGVSAQTYWLARGLAHRGHSVHVVTNADEVEAAYRLDFGADDWSWYQPVFPDTGGSVTVYNPQPFSARAMGHIPASNPFVTKLASLATDVVRRYGCEKILSYYYEPYAVAAWMASQWTRTPLLVKHAGSDLDRLFGIPDLATAYKEILRTADAVITQPRLMLRFLGMGVAADRLETDVAYALPTDIFNSAAEPISADRLGRSIADGARAAAFDPDLPSIGVYGKIGQTKGTFDLIAALGRLASEGRRFQFLAMIGAAHGDALRPALVEAGLAERTWILPLRPNWRVPAFIRTCTAVCFLERDFPVPIHGPVVPREILACGSCLVLSGEIAEKQRYRERLIPGDNVIIVDDPRDHDALTSALRPLIVNPSATRAIGARGARLAADLENHGAFIDGWHRVLTRRQRLPPAPALASLETTIPALVALLRTHQPEIVDEFLASANGSGAFQIGIEFCEYAAARVESSRFGEATPTLLDALRYLRARMAAAHDPAGDYTPTFPVSDRLNGRPVSPELVSGLRPVRANSVWIEEFDHDVSSLFPPLPPGTPVADAAVDLTAAPREPLLVLFHRSPNLVMRELRIDEATRELVKRCDGTSTTSELVRTFCRDFGSGAPDEEEGAAVRILEALDRLYRARVIVFGERHDGWGWSGGPR
jgi:glycosyltransferase involved in cell wall biosynthesis